MTAIRCICGETLEGADDASLFVAVRVHTNESHAEITLPDAAITDMIEASKRMEKWDGRRRELPSAPEVRTLTPPLLDDYLEFFDRVAFADNPSWADCYCLEPHLARGDGGNDRSAAQNRADKIELIQRGEAHGHIAYAEGQPIGWCNAAPRSTLAWVTSNPELACDDAERVGSIVCFVVAPAYRRQGLATRLLDAACGEFRRRGLAIAEAYPAVSTTTQPAAFRGPIDMYLEAGFERVRETRRNTIVRKML